MRFIRILLLLVISFSATMAGSVMAGENAGAVDHKLVNWLRHNVCAETGMPFSFAVPGPQPEGFARIGKADSVTGVIERMIVKEGISVYDAALWQIVLAHTGDPGDLSLAERPLQYYWQGSLGELRDIRTGSGRQMFVYDPADPQAVSLDEAQPGQRGFLFRIIDAYGRYSSTDPLDGKASLEGFPNGAYLHWEDWKPIAGENAWVVMGALHVLKCKAAWGRIDTSSDAFRLAEELARAAMVLQAANGGIRMAPLGTYYHLIGIDPSSAHDAIVASLDGRARDVQDEAEESGSMFSDHHRWYYEEISTENNLSWYAAFRMLWELTREEKYRQAMVRIEDYLHSVWDADRGFFYQGAHFRDGAWQPNQEPFATDVQYLSIAVLGPGTLDGWFGQGASRRLWERTKLLSGIVDDQGRLLGVGYTREHDRLSIEWTAGAILAVRRLREYYESRDSAFTLVLLDEEQSMRSGVEAYRYTLPGDREAYPYSSRRGWIPFGWFSHDKDVLSLASTSWVALIDAGVDPLHLPVAPAVFRDRLSQRRVIAGPQQGEISQSP